MGFIEGRGLWKGGFGMMDFLWEDVMLMTKLVNDFDDWSDPIHSPMFQTNDE